MTYMFKVNTFGNLKDNKQDLQHDLESYIATQCDSNFLIAINPDTLTAYLNRQYKATNLHAKHISKNSVVNKLRVLIHSQAITWIPNFDLEVAGK